LRYSRASILARDSTQSGKRGANLRQPVDYDCSGGETLGLDDRGIPEGTRQAGDKFAQAMVKVADIEPEEYDRL
jgi:hypothetical protein